MYMRLLHPPCTPLQSLASAAVHALVCCELASGHDLSLEVVQL